MALFPGNVVSDRFVIETLAATGGMGWVYRATDRAVGGRVAIKVLRTDVGSLDADARERFMREARVLAQLSHPGIIRYVAHGVTAAGEPYLAMEWVEGETLSQRLSRGPLGVGEAVLVARSTAEALAAAHAVGIVHRDVKPSNLVLVDNRIDRIKLIDFGVARLSLGGRDLTRTGFAVGTAIYMAPEQARGAEIDGRADLYALGVVLYKALTGEAPFIGEDLLAILAKVLLQPAPSLRLRREDVPEQLDHLVSALLAKDPNDRPATAAIAAQLAASIDMGEIARSSIASIRMTGREQRLVSLIAIRPSRTGDTTEVTVAARPSASDPVDAIAARFGARVEHVGNGAALVIVVARGTGTDLAVTAARCALALRPIVPDASLAIATGSADLTFDVPVGDVIDRAASLAHATGGVRLDDLTARLLEDRFVVVSDPPSAVLVAEREGSELARLLLGKPTPCVGRDREIGMLLGIAEDAVREPTSRAVLLVGPAGCGKSRVRHELVRQLAQAHEASVWFARGDPISQGAHLETIRQLARAAVAKTETMTPFLAELLDVPRSTEDVQLHAARANPVLMGDQMRLAWEDLVRSACEKHLVAIIIEDLQWSDPASVRWIDSMLGQLQDRPLFVLATARPEVDESFPRLWENRAVSRIGVPPLGKKSCELLVKHVLGDRVPRDQVTALIDQSAGNPFFLEELIRDASEGKPGSAPATVVTMVQAQLEKLEPFARRALRAASVFGQTFHREGLQHLLQSDIDDALAHLVQREVIRPSPSGEYLFRHDLVRQAAYASLTPGDAKAAHRMAAIWLEKQGRTSALVIAEHYERGGAPSRAARSFLRAAEQALEANDFGGAIEQAKRALACGLAEVAPAHHVMATAHRWRGEGEDAWNAARAAMSASEKHSSAWYEALVELAHAGFRTSRMNEVRAIVEEVLEFKPDAPSAARIRALATLSKMVARLPERETLDRLVARVDIEVAALGEAPDVIADVEMAHGMRAQMQGDHEASLVHVQRRKRALVQMGNLRGIAEASNTLGFAHMVLGNDRAAEVALRDGMEIAKRASLPRELAQCRANLALVVGRRDVGEGIALAKESLDAFVVQGDEPLLASSHLDLGSLYLQKGDLDLAEEHTRKGLDLAERASPVLVIYARATLAMIMLERGRIQDALEHAAFSFAQRGDIALYDPGDAIIDLAYAETLKRLGRLDEARDVIGKARDRLMQLASSMNDEANRRAFLENVPENKALLAFSV